MQLCRCRGYLLATVTTIAWLMLVYASTGDRWHCRPQQDFFVEILLKLRRQDLAAANLVSRSWHAGIHQQYPSLELRPVVSLAPAAHSGLSCF